MAETARSSSPPMHLWGFVVTLTIILVVGLFAFLGVTWLREGPQHARTADDLNCQVRNEKIVELNGRFALISELLEAIVASHPHPVSLSVNAQRLLAESKRPVPLVECGRTQ